MPKDERLGVRVPDEMLRSPRRHAMHKSDNEVIAELASVVTLAVRATGVLEGASEATWEYAGGIVEREFGMFCRGEGDYGDALRAVVLGTRPEGTAISLVVRRCAEKVAAFTQEDALTKEDLN